MKKADKDFTSSSRGKPFLKKGLFPEPLSQKLSPFIIHCQKSGLIFICFFLLGFVAIAETEKEPVKGTIEETDYNLVLMQNGLPYTTISYAPGREMIGLNGDWFFQTDSDNVGENEGWFNPEFSRDGWRTHPVPGTWNAVFEDLFRYEGVGWYARKVDRPDGIEGKLARLAIHAAFLESKVWFNGYPLGSHSGGYTPAYYEIKTDMWRDDDNWLVVRVDNLITDKTVPTTTMIGDRHGWYPWGGITRDVYLEILPPVYIFKADIRAVPINDFKNGDFTAYVGIHNMLEEPVEVEISAAVMPTKDLLSSAPPNTPDFAATPEFIEEIKKDVRIGPHSVELPALGTKFVKLSAVLPNVNLWLEHPSGYQLFITTKSLEGSDFAGYYFAFRKFEIDGEKILLDGKPRFLYGINRHEDAPETGFTQPYKIVVTDGVLLRKLGVNHIRPGHYPCHSAFLRMMDLHGVTVTEEIPVYQNTGRTMSDPEVIANAETQLIEMIERDRNHPSIIIWSLANEINTFTPESADFIRHLKAVANKWDPTRPVTVEIAVNPFVTRDYVSDIVDIVSLNQYFGWYYGRINDLDKFLDKYHKKFPGRPYIISEFGAGALYGRHVGKVGPEPHSDHSYSEEFQDMFYRRQWKIIASKPYVVGAMPWVFADFHMEWEPTTGKPHPVEWMNLKGLLSLNREKKKAFFTIQELYREHKASNPSSQ